MKKQNLINQSQLQTRFSSIHNQRLNNIKIWQLLFIKCKKNAQQELDMYSLI